MNLSKPTLEKGAIHTVNLDNATNVEKLCIKAITKPVKRKMARNVSNTCLLQFLAVDAAAECADVTCVFVSVVLKGEHATVAVPLWGHYTATWRGESFKCSKWFIFSNEERWFKQIVDAIATKSAREVAKKVYDMVRLEFQAHLKDTRGENDTRDDSDSEPDTQEPVGKKRATRGVEAVPIQLSFGNHSMTSINTSKRVVLLSDQRSAAFIMGYVVPLVRHVVIVIQEEATASATDTASTDSPSTIANFHSLGARCQIYEANFRGMSVDTSGLCRAMIRKPTRFQRTNGIGMRSPWTPILTPSRTNTRSLHSTAVQLQFGIAAKPARRVIRSPCR